MSRFLARAEQARADRLCEFGFKALCSRRTGMSQAPLILRVDADGNPFWSRELPEVFFR